MLLRALLGASLALILLAEPLPKATPPSPAADAQQMTDWLVNALSDGAQAGKAGVAGPDSPTVRRWRERVDQVHLFSEPTFAVTSGEASSLVRVELRASGLSRTAAALPIELP